MCALATRFGNDTKPRLFFSCRAYGVTGFGDVQQNINYFRAARKLRVKALEHHAEELTAKGIQVTIHVLHGDGELRFLRSWACCGWVLMITSSQLAVG